MAANIVNSTLQSKRKHKFNHLCIGCYLFLFFLSFLNSRYPCNSIHFIFIVDECQCVRNKQHLYCTHILSVKTMGKYLSLFRRSFECLIGIVIYENLNKIDGKTTMGRLNAPFLYIFILAMKSNNVNAMRSYTPLDLFGEKKRYIDFRFVFEFKVLKSIAFCFSFFVFKLLISFFVRSEVFVTPLVEMMWSI